MADIVRPIEPFELTQGFGENPALYARFGLKGHNGWDFRTKWPDTPAGFRYILASWLMTFYRRGDEGNDGFGRYFETVCKLYSTWKLTFAHCDSIENFTTKNEGESMAISDNTGNSTGSHLHFTPKRIKIVNGVHEVQDYNNGYFGAVDPQLFFDELRKFKATGKDPVAPKEDIIMQVDSQTFEHLVEGSTVRKELANYIRENGGSGFDDPDHTPLDKFKSYIGGLKSAITDRDNRLNDKDKELAAAKTEVENQKDKVANVIEQCQRTDKLRLDEINRLKKDAKSSEELVTSYKGTIETLESKVKDLQTAGGKKDTEISKLKKDLEAAQKGQPKSDPLALLVAALKKYLKG